MDGATLETHFSQADWDLVCQSLPSPTPVRSQLPISTDLWLRILHDLTADRQPHRALPLVEEQPAAEQSATELDVTSSSVHLPASTLIVPQQLLPYVSKYNFETCRSTYFVSRKRTSLFTGKSEQLFLCCRSFQVSRRRLKRQVCFCPPSLGLLQSWNLPEGLFFW